MREILQRRCHISSLVFKGLGMVVANALIAERGRKGVGSYDQKARTKPCAADRPEAEVKP
jgi:hypothetical protein